MRQARRNILSQAIQRPEVCQSPCGTPQRIQIRHPLLKCTCNWDEEEAAKQELKEKVSLFLSAARDQDWLVCVGLLRPRYRVNFLNAIKDKCVPRKFCELLKFILTDGSPLKAQATLLHRTFKRLQYRKADGQDFQPLIMSSKELARFNDLPDPVEVWRGSGDCDLGWTWTLDRYTARWYASKYAKANPRRQGFVHKARVRKDQILALLSDLPVGQETVIIDPGTLTVISSKPFGVECRYRSPEKRYLGKVKPNNVPSETKPTAVEISKPCSDEERQAVLQWAQECLEEQASRPRHKESLRPSRYSQSGR